VGVSWFGWEGGAKTAALIAISNANLLPGIPYTRQKLNRSADYVTMKTYELGILESMYALGCSAVSLVQVTDCGDDGQRAGQS